MATIWFCLVALMIAMYVLLDGFDLGAGAIHLLVAKTDDERRQVLASIGPVWDGNEVWLLAAGGTLYFAFPQLYASGFSGFYLPLMIVLWLLILRGIAIEFRNHLHSLVWEPVWDFLFCASSLLLAVFYGAALGNVVRGVPLDGSRYFFEPLWTNFRLGAETGILDWYTILVGVFALVALVMHGSLWVQMKTFMAKRSERNAFLSSCFYLAGMLTSVVFGVYPMVLPARNPEYSLTIDSAKAGAYGLKIGLIWWVIGIMLATGYFVFVYRSFAGKVTAGQSEGGHKS
jgi:cytochrome bd-type quinol oxidase subunit 2